MDKIYSRKRLLIPKLRVNKRNSNSNENYANNINNKLSNSKTLKTAIVVIIAVFMANKIISVIEPTMDIMCIDMAKSIATRISNEQATVVMREIQL